MKKIVLLLLLVSITSFASESKLFELPSSQLDDEVLMRKIVTAIDKEPIAFERFGGFENYHHYLGAVAIRDGQIGLIVETRAEPVIPHGTILICNLFVTGNKFNYAVKEINCRIPGY